MNKIDNTKRLNLGCGNDIMEGFINIDIRELSGIDIRADIVRLPIKDSSIELIMLNDVLEHFRLEVSIKVLKECYRALVDDGQLNIRVPDIIGLTGLVKEDKVTAFNYQEFIYGGQDYSKNFHKSGYTPQFLAGICAAVGFRRIDLIEKEYPNFRMLVKR